MFIDKTSILSQNLGHYLYFLLLNFCYFNLFQESLTADCAGEVSERYYLSCAEADRDIALLNEFFVHPQSEISVFRIQCRPESVKFTGFQIQLHTAEFGFYPGGGDLHKVFTGSCAVFRRRTHKKIEYRLIVRIPGTVNGAKR